MAKGSKFVTITTVPTYMGYLIKLFSFDLKGSYIGATRIVWRNTNIKTVASDTYKNTKTTWYFISKADASEFSTGKVSVKFTDKSIHVIGVDLNSTGQSAFDSNYSESLVLNIKNYGHINFSSPSQVSNWLKQCSYGDNLTLSTVPGDDKGKETLYSFDSYFIPPSGGKGAGAVHTYPYRSIDPFNRLDLYRNDSYSLNTGGRLYSFNTTNLLQSYINQISYGNPPVAASPLNGSWAHFTSGQGVQTLSLEQIPDRHDVGITHTIFTDTLAGGDPGQGKTFYVCADPASLNYYVTTFVHYTSSGIQVPTNLTSADILEPDNVFIHVPNFCEECDPSFPLQVSTSVIHPTTCEDANGRIIITPVGGTIAGTNAYTYTLYAENSSMIVSSFTPPSPIDGVWTHTFSGLSGGNYTIVVGVLNACKEHETQSMSVNLPCITIEITEICSDENALNSFTPTTLAGAGAVIGQEFQGGIVFKINDAGTAALVVSKIDITDVDNTNSVQSAHAWALNCTTSDNPACSTSVNGATNATALYTGSTNTSNIISRCDGGDCDHTAAWIAQGHSDVDSITGQTYNDWYLPSREELKTMVDVLHTTAHSTTTGLVTAQKYWSSSETAANAYFVTADLNATATDATTKKEELGRIRAVRTAVLINQYQTNNTLCLYCNTNTGKYSLGDTVDQSQAPFIVFNETITTNVSVTVGGSANTDGSAFVSFTPTNYSNGDSTYEWPLDFPAGYWQIEYKRILIQDVSPVITASGYDYVEWAAAGLLDNATTVTGTTSPSFQFEDFQHGRYFMRVKWIVDGVAVEIEQCYTYGEFVVGITGCTDSNANNYNSLALEDNGNCTYDLTGDLGYYLRFRLRNANINNAPDACQFQQIAEFLIDPSGAIGTPSGGNPAFTAPDYADWIPLAEDLDQPGNLVDAVKFLIATQSGVDLTLVASNISISEFTITYTYLTASEDGSQTGSESVVSLGDADNIMQDGGTRQVITFPANVPTIAGQVGIITWNIYFIGTYVNGATENDEFVSFSSSPPLVYFLQGVDGLCPGCDAMNIANGCTDPVACNYDPDANVDDGTCQTNTEVCGCTDNNYLEYYYQEYYDYGQYLINGTFETQYPNNPNLPHPTISSFSLDSQCNTPIVGGCMSPLYLEFNPLANLEDGSCVTYIIEGCMEADACNYNPGANVSDSSCVYVGNGDCGTFEWKIATSSVAPSNCGGNDNSDGILVLVSDEWNGPFQMNIIGPGFISADTDVIWAAGFNAGSSGGGVGEINSEATQSGPNSETHPTYSYTITQTSSGTSVTISGMSSGVYSITMTSLGDPTSPTYSEDTAESLCFCATSQDAIENDASGVFIIENPGGEGRSTYGQSPTRISMSASSADCGCTDINSTGFVVSATVDDGSCVVYGCMDETATNFNAAATLSCTDPENQQGAPYGIPGTINDVEGCQPCVYGYLDVMYTPQFCMPSQMEQQINVVKNCIATAGTEAYLSTISGRSNSNIQDAWKLILIEYLLSKKGLSCLYNCAADGTKDLTKSQTCTSKGTYKGEFINNIGPGGNQASGTQVIEVFDLGSTILYSLDGKRKRYYKLKKLPVDQPFVMSSLQGSNPLIVGHSMVVYNQSTFATQYPNMNGANLLATLSPSHPYGSTLWKLCENPPTKPHDKDYLGKFLTFVETYCRSCAVLPVENKTSVVNTSTVLTIGGIVISVNNNNFE